MGLLVAPDDSHALTAAVMNALNHSHQPLRDNARDYAENFLDIDKVMIRFLKGATAKDREQASIKKTVLEMQVLQAAS
jgi:hypothetical protein